MARVTIFNEGNLWPGTTSIADLAQFTPILQRDSNELSIYAVQEAFEADWRFEIASWEYEYGTGYTAEFKDGSKIGVGAWWTESRNDDDQWDD